MPNIQTSSQKTKPKNGNFNIFGVSKIKFSEPIKILAESPSPNYSKKNEENPPKDELKNAKPISSRLDPRNKELLLENKPNNKNPIQPTLESKTQENSRIYATKDIKIEVAKHNKKENVSLVSNIQENEKVLTEKPERREEIDDVKEESSSKKDIAFENLDKAISQTKAGISQSLNKNNSEFGYQKPEFNKTKKENRNKKEKTISKPVQKDLAPEKDFLDKKYNKFTKDLDSFLDPERKVGSISLDGKDYIRKLRKNVLKRPGQSLALDYDNNTPHNENNEEKVIYKCVLKDIILTLFLLVLLLAVLFGAFHYYKTLNDIQSNGDSVFVEAKVLGISELDTKKLGGDFTPASLDLQNNQQQVPVSWLEENFSQYVVNGKCLDSNICDLSSDPDKDGLINLYEYNFATNPNSSDSDGDGLSDGDEVFVFNTSPTRFSSNNRQIGDGAELVLCQNPTKNIKGNLLSSEKEIIKNNIQKYSLQETTKSFLIRNEAEKEDLKNGFIEKNCLEKF